MITIGALGKSQAKSLSEIASKRGTANLSSQSLHSEDLHAVKQDIVQGLSKLVTAIRATLSGVTGDSATGLNHFIQNASDGNFATHADSMSSITQHLDAVKTLKTQVDATQHPQLANDIDHFETTLTQAAQKVKISAEITSELSATIPGFDSLPKTDQSHLTGLFKQGIVSAGDPASKEFLTKLGAMLSSVKGDTQFISTTIQNLAKGDLDTAILIQGFSVANKAPTGISGHLDAIVTRIGLHGEAQGTQRQGTTHATQALRYLAKTLAGSLQMADGHPLQSLSSIKFDAKTVLTLLTATSDKFKLDKDMVNIAFGQAMILQHQLDGGLGDIDAQLKQAGIEYTQKDIKALTDKGVSGSGQLTHMSQIVQSFAKGLGKSVTLKHALTSQLTHQTDIVAAKYQQRLFTKLTGLTGMDASQRGQMLSKLVDTVDFNSGDLKRTKIAGVTVISGNAKTKMKSLVTQQKTVSDILTTLKPMAKSLQSIQAQLEMATDTQKDKVITLADKQLSQVSTAKKEASRSMTTLTALIRMAIVDTMESHGFSDDAVHNIQHGHLTADIASALTGYGLSTSQAKDCETLIRFESIKFKGAESIKSWAEAITLDKAQEKQIQSAEKMATSHFIQGLSTTETGTVKEVKSWVDGITKEGKLLIDMTKGTTVSGSKLAQLSQEAFLMGTSIDITRTTENSKAMLIEQSPHPTDPSKDAFTVTLSQSTAKSLGISLDLLGGLITLGQTRGAKTTSGVQLQFFSKHALTLFFSGLMHNTVNMAASLADISQVMMVDGKKVSVTNSLDIGINAQDFIPVDLSASGIDLPGLGVSVQTTHSKEVTTTQNLDKTTIEKTVEHRYEVSGAMIDAVIPTIGVTTTAQLHYTQNVLTGATQTKQYQVDFGMESALSKTITQKGMELVLSSSIKKTLKANPSKMEEFKSMIKTLQKGDTVKVEYGLSPALSFQIASMMDASSPNYNPDKAKALLADQKQYMPIAIQVISTSSTKHTKTDLQASNVTVTRQKGVSEWQVKAEIRL